MLWKAITAVLRSVFGPGAKTDPSRRALLFGVAAVGLLAATPAFEPAATPQSVSHTRYWVGDENTLSHKGHWSTVSGGPADASAPTEHDDVVFDAASAVDGQIRVEIGRVRNLTIGVTGARLHVVFPDEVECASFSIENVDLRRA